MTIVLTTHYLEEAENLCDRIAIINHGKLIALKTTPELVGMAREKLVELTLDRDISQESDAVTFADDLFLKAEIIGPRTIAVTYNKDRTNAGGVMEAIQKRGYQIVDVTTREADLEDVFLNLTRKAS